MIEIIKYKKEDLSEITRLFSELQEYERKIYPDRRIGNEVAEEYMKTFHPRGKQKDIIYIAKENNKYIGFIWAYIEKEIINKSEVMYISDLFVEEMYRGKGIGKMLIERVEKEAKDKELKNIMICVLIDNTNAHRTYTNLGYKDSEVTMIKRIV